MCYEIKEKAKVEPTQQQRTVKKNKKLPKSKGKREKVRREREKAAELRLRRKEEQDKALLGQLRDSVSLEKYHLRYSNPNVWNSRKREINALIRQEHPEISHLTYEI